MLLSRPWGGYGILLSRIASHAVHAYKFLPSFPSGRSLLPFHALLRLVVPQTLQSYPRGNARQTASRLGHGPRSRRAYAPKTGARQSACFRCYSPCGIVYPTSIPTSTPHIYTTYHSGSLNLPRYSVACLSSSESFGLCATYRLRRFRAYCDSPLTAARFRFHTASLSYRLAIGVQSPLPIARPFDGATQDASSRLFSSRTPDKSPSARRNSLARTLSGCSW